MREQIIINNLLINYYRFRKEGEKTVIFLHGWRSEGTVWNDITKRIGDSGFAMYALDLPGFGSSAVPKEALSIGDYAEIVALFINKLGLKNIILVGHSFGGRISIKLASTRPELIDKVVLVDSAGLRLDSANVNCRNAIAKLAKPFFRPKFMQGLRHEIYKKMGSEDYVATPYLKETYLKTVEEDLRRYLPQIEAPTLIIWGKEDRETPLEFAEVMNKEIKNSHKVVIDEAGHFCFIDKPVEFTDELLKFISS